MLQPLRLLRGRAGDYVIAPPHRLGAQRGKQPSCLLIAVLQLVNFRTERLRAVEPPDRALMGDAAQKAAGDPPCAGSPSPQLPRHNAGDPPGGPLAVKALPNFRRRIQFHLPGRFQAAVGAGIGVLIIMGVSLDLRRLRLCRRQVVEASQIHISIDCRRVFRFHDVRRSPITYGASDGRNGHAIQRIRIPGAPEVLHICPCLLHGFSDLPHEGVLPHPRPAFENHQIKSRFRIHDFRKQILKTAAAVCA